MSLRENLEAGTRAARQAKFPTTLELEHDHVIVRMTGPRSTWSQSVDLIAIEKAADLIGKLIRTGEKELG